MNHKYRPFWKRNLRFWAFCLLQCLGVILGASVIGILIGVLGSVGNSGENGGGLFEVLETLAALYPWYILLISGLFLTLWPAGCIRVYFPVLSAVGCTRRGMAAGLGGTVGGMAAAVLTCVSLIWNFLDHDAAVSARSLILPAGGILLALSALGVLFGILCLCSGRKVMALLGGLIGGTGFGIGVAEGMQSVSGGLPLLGRLVRYMTEGNAWAGAACLGGGVLLLILALLLLVRCLRRIELRL